MTVEETWSSDTDDLDGDLDDKLDDDLDDDLPDELADDLDGISENLADNLADGLGCANGLSIAFADSGLGVVVCLYQISKATRHRLCLVKVIL